VSSSAKKIEEKWGLEKGLGQKKLWITAEAAAPEEKIN
jgi:hypothetical protein